MGVGVDDAVGVAVGVEVLVDFGVMVGVGLGVGVFFPTPGRNPVITSISKLPDGLLSTTLTPS